VALEKASAIKRNGMARPTEKTVSITPPVKAVPLVPAKRRMEPRIGPTHGVHPSANVPPIKRELEGLPSVSQEGMGMRLSLWKNGSLKNPSIKRPKSMTKTPPMRASQMRYGASAVPANPASIPNVIKTSENPTINARPLRNIFRRAALAVSGFFSASWSTPLMNPRYAGTSGKVHGARKVSSPAKNDAITNPMLSSIIVILR